MGICSRRLALDPKWLEPKWLRMTALIIRPEKGGGNNKARAEYLCAAIDFFLSWGDRRITNASQRKI